MRIKIVVIHCAAMSLGASLCFADASAFLPRSWDNGAYLDLYSSYEQDDNRRETQPFGWSDLFLREKITLFSNGYVYHPRFLQYQISIAGALKQEDYEASFLEPLGWKHATGTEYDARLFFLAEHPFNVNLFAFRYEPLFKEQAAAQHNSVESSRGILLQYRRKPYLFHSKYSVDTIDSGFTWTEIRRLGLDGEYFKHYENGNQLSFTGAFNPSRSTTSQQVESDTSQYLLGNVIDLRSVRLNSSVTSNSYDQDSPLSGRFTNDQFGWYELLNVYFPHHLRTDLTYRRQDNQSTIPETLTSGERELTDDNRDIQLDIVHRLYQSLDTTYTYLDTARESSSGDTRTGFHNLNLSYTKLIPRGRAMAGLNLGRGETESHGATDVVSEPHNAVAVPGSFTLVQQNIDPVSIAVFLKSPLPPFGNIQLVENVHYLLTAIGNTFQIDILTLPPQFAVPGTFDFFVSYTLTGGDFDLGTRTLGASTSVDLLDTMLTPYYAYVAIRSEVLSGVFPGVPLDSTTNTVGMRFQRGPYRARGEYQNLQWEVSPYRAWRGEFQYVSSLNPTTGVYGTVTYVNKYYPQGTSLGLPEAYTDETASASGSVRKEIPPRGLALSAGGSVSRTLGRVDTTAFSLNSSLTWKVGKLTVTAGANAYGNDTSGSTSAETSRFHQYYYVTLRREFF